MQLTDTQVVKAGKALGHPLRLKLIRDLQQFGCYSPVRWSEDNELPMGNVNYHFKALQKLGIIKLISTKKGRGAIEHHYGLAAGKLAGATVAVLDVLEDKAELAPVSSKKGGMRAKVTAGLVATEAQNRSHQTP